MHAAAMSAAAGPGTASAVFVSGAVAGGVFGSVGMGGFRLVVRMGMWAATASLVPVGFADGFAAGSSTRPGPAPDVGAASILARLATWALAQTLAGTRESRFAAAYLGRSGVFSAHLVAGLETLRSWASATCSLPWDSSVLAGARYCTCAHEGASRNVTPCQAPLAAVRRRACLSWDRRQATFGEKYATSGIRPRATNPPEVRP